MATLTLPQGAPLKAVGADDVGAALVPRITASEYLDLMDRVGLGGDNRWELVDGYIRRVDKSGPGEPRTTVNPLHNFVSRRLARLAPRFEPHGCHLRAEMDVALTDDDVPIPDASVVVGDEFRYLRAHPRPHEVLCVIEVADSSESFDLGDKLRHYAAAGIGTYVVLRLRAGSAVVLTEPSADGYATRRDLSIDDALSLPTADGTGVDVPLIDLLPPLPPAEAL